MKVLVIGSGGREHAICWKLSQSPLLTKLYCAPANPGIAEIALTEKIPVTDITGLVNFAESIQADLTVVGPEVPLSLGLVDAFEEKGLKIFGPSQEAAQLESSKVFAKEIMSVAGVPTASAKIFDDWNSLSTHLKQASLPLVLKADGLAAGKGVFVCKSRDEVEEALKCMSEMKNAASRVVVEDFLDGVEISYIVATDGTRIVPLAASHDYKRLLDKDAGPNTGGMGSVCPTPRISPAIEEFIKTDVINPILVAMRKRGTPFKGFLYAGLMLRPSGKVQVLEFNVRLGDPETQSILRRMEGDLLQLLVSLSQKEGSLNNISWNEKACVCVVLAAKGYPDNPQKGQIIDGIHEAQGISDVVVFQAGTALDASANLLSNGGRVLNVTALGKDLKQARERAYAACEKISFVGKHYRKDIALN
ncbi:MAG: phosphoribosylamine--glycine ligase [SAR324 cluster bacterium]|uniref:Phosphoribosylamine--glycine ligase n=1 Tax=SAR324 cluster bacterium TaxID=2024889 RepID=A0A7X9FT70_9DELT|nr:phosphoribosylamine--glycine ligase [SAR324 cluster bacterium]